MTEGKITGILANLLDVVADGPVQQNEICYVMAQGRELRAEVIKVMGDTVAAQVFEDTSQLMVGDKVRFTGKMLEVSLGPGLLSKNLDGLQSDLEKLEGVFLQIGQTTPALDEGAVFAFEPIAKIGNQLKAGDWIGQVRENWIDHKIMVPFSFTGTFEVKQVAAAGNYKISETMAQLVDSKGETHHISMVQKWPVKKGIRAYQEKRRPTDILLTGMRVMDTLNPILQGGTGFIPGAFGTGKTVLQQSIAKNGEADIIILVACGERANEVVEIFKEFPELTDPRTGRKLSERTTIICNTSNMPVAAREASVYVGMTIAEYYRCMGLKVLLLADSTSRWAQALREMSNRLEELPGDDAYPVDLPATIASFYSRAGQVVLNNGQKGSVTFLGTVSPAGGNFKEPVTESTRKVAGCYFALSQKRADAKRYPAIDPLESYSKYLEYEEFKEQVEKDIQPGWTDSVTQTKNLVRRGLEAKEQIDILGEDAVPLDYHINFWRSELIDFAFIQQDSFDPVDTNSSIERQQYMLNKVLKTCAAEPAFEAFEEVSGFYKKLINILRQMNYSDFDSEDFKKYEQQLDDMLSEQVSA